jgi:predicted deacylase
MVEVFEYRTKLPGPTLLVFGAVHGNEVCGPNSLYRLKRELDEGSLKLLQGNLLLVPVANPEAYRLGKRLVEKNLNRVFEPRQSAQFYEERIANELCPLIARCDYFLDLHSMTAKGEPFVFLNENNSHSKEFCLSLGAKKVMTGWPELYSSSGQSDSCCTQTYADRLGKPNALIECGTHGTPEADEVAYEAVRGALAYLEMAEKIGKRSPEEVETLKLTHVYFRESAGDTLVKEWNTFDAVREGELIAWVGEFKNEYRASENGFIIFPHAAAPVGTELFYLAVRLT